jgi:hypothetical protein
VLRSFAFSFVTIAVLSAGCDLTGPCVNSPVIDIPSPNGDLKAWVFVRDCGATTAKSVQVSVLPVENATPSGSGNTFIIDQQSTVVAEWPEPRKLLISYEPRGDVFKQEIQVAGVEVSYRKE